MGSVESVGRFTVNSVEVAKMSRRLAASGKDAAQMEDRLLKAKQACAKGDGRWSTT